MNAELLQVLIDLFKESTMNRLPSKYGGTRIFSSPLFGVARGDDPIFQKYKELIAPEHLTPLELWLSEGFESMSPSNLRIISIVFPFSKKIREASKIINKGSQITLPAEIYCVGRNYANDFKKEICVKIIEFFKLKGYNSVAAMLSESLSILRPKREVVYSTWSERHIAFATGLGTFSLHEGLITKVGCNIRLVSIVTDAPLDITTRKDENPYSNCLYYSKGDCRRCEIRCPANAIDENGHDKLKCYAYNRKIAEIMFNRIGPILKPHIRRVNWVLRPESYPVGCAFCQFDVPCMDKNPMEKP